jgi:hypothetical protein
VIEAQCASILGPHDHLHINHVSKSLLENSGCGWLGGGALAGETTGHDDDHGQKVCPG